MLIHFMFKLMLSTLFKPYYSSDKRDKFFSNQLVYRHLFHIILFKKQFWCHIFSLRSMLLKEICLIVKSCLIFFWMKSFDSSWFSWLEWSIYQINELLCIRCLHSVPTGFYCLFVSIIKSFFKMSRVPAIKLQVCF